MMDQVLNLIPAPLLDPPVRKCIQCNIVNNGQRPSGKASGCVKKKDLGSIPLRLSSLFQSCGLRT